MANDMKQSVRWQDGTYDSQRECLCGLPNCTTPYYQEKYKVIGSDVTAADWLDEKIEKLGGESSDENNNVSQEIMAAHPEFITEREDVPSSISETLRNLADRAYEVLSKRQKDVWDICMRQGRTEEAAARELGIERVSVQVHIRAAKAKFTEYLREHSNETL